MVDVCEQLRPDFDFILIDSPAGIEQGFKNALAPADKVCIITTPELASVRDADRVVGLVEAEEKGPDRRDFRGDFGSVILIPACLPPDLSQIRKLLSQF